MRNVPSATQLASLVLGFFPNKSKPLLTKEIPTVQDNCLLVLLVKQSFLFKIKESRLLSYACPSLKFQLLNLLNYFKVPLCPSIVIPYDLTFCFFAAEAMGLYFLAGFSLSFVKYNMELLKLIICQVMSHCLTKSAKRLACLN